MKINKLTPGKNLRWESSRMMLPEHVQALHDHEVEEEKVAKPVLDDQEIETIDRLLRQSLEQSQPLNIEYYDQGFKKKTDWIRGPV
ncbi:YolD-like family protein [Terrilactibacillus sp. S3-3]|nr:YolD-like family protein [Terrilactibacillus sp. S3-3]